MMLKVMLRIFSAYPLSVLSKSCSLWNISAFLRFYKNHLWFFWNNKQNIHIDRAYKYQFWDLLKISVNIHHLPSSPLREADSWVNRVSIPRFHLFNPIFLLQFFLLISSFYNLQWYSTACIKAQLCFHIKESFRNLL